MIFAFKPSGAPTDFEAQMLPHLEAAFRLAHALTRDRMAAQDAVQDSYLKAFQAWGRFQPGNARAWLLTIVRRQSYDWLRREKGYTFVDIEDETTQPPSGALSYAGTQEEALMESQSNAALLKAISELSAPHREVIILRDFQELSYSEIAGITGVPMGTVMSRLSRARDILRAKLGSSDHD